MKRSLCAPFAMFLASLAVAGAHSVEAKPAELAKISVTDLRVLLDETRGQPDAQVAKRLSELELTERLSTAKLTSWEADLPGDKARQALIVLADASAFLDRPAVETSVTDRPDLAAQRKILALAVNYLVQALPKLPSFFATRNLSRFEDVSQIRVGTRAMLYTDARFRLIDSSSARVLYRAGREVVAPAGEAPNESPQPAPMGLATWGVFGPLLGTVMKDALGGKVFWSGWEQGSSGSVAVFRYEVPEEKSHYQVGFCCVIPANTMGSDSQGAHIMAPVPFNGVPAYHGELAIDPGSGAVLRLTIRTDLQPGLPISRADTMVEYGLVAIGGETYLCPVKSVSLSKTMSSMADTSGKGKFVDLEPPTTSINEVVFNEYHLFRGDMRILPQGKDEQDTNPAAPVPPAVSHEP